MAEYKATVNVKRGNMAKFISHSGSKEVVADFSQPLEFAVASFVTVSVDGSTITVKQEGKKQVGKLRGRSEASQLK